MNIYYEGKDIYEDISLNQCFYDSYGEQQADTVKFLFNDTKDLWNKWKPEEGDRIEAKLGVLRTGTMNISSIKPENGLMCIRASSVPGNCNAVSNKSWESVTFKQLCKEIAARHNLSCDFYEVQDQTYVYVNQQNMQDFIFLEQRCVLEGCAFLVYDEKMIVYSEAAMEARDSKHTLYIDNDSKFDYRDDSDKCYGKCVVKNSEYKSAYSSGSSGRTMEKVLNFKISSQGEADRFAKNLLRYENKNMATGILWSGEYLPGYTAGSTVDLNTNGVPTWDGQVFVTHVRHDFVKATSKIWFRKPLEGY